MDFLDIEEFQQYHSPMEKLAEISKFIETFCGRTKNHVGVVEAAESIGWCSDLNKDQVTFCEE